MSLLSEVLQEVLNPKFVIQSKNELPYFRNAKQAFEYAKLINSNIEKQMKLLNY